MIPTTTEGELPADLQLIRDIEAARPNRLWPYVRHQIQYTYGEADDATALADFIAQGPLSVPTVGQIIKLHGVRMKVLDVEVGYEAMEDGAPAVFAAIRVELADPAPSDPGSGT